MLSPLGVGRLLLMIGIVLLIAWAVGLVVFHLGSIIYIALIAGLALMAYHWWARGRAGQGQ